MRIWSIHPVNLDTKGLCGAWRELLGAIKSCDPSVGYSRHSQLIRWRNATDSIEMMRNALAHYGLTLYQEAKRRKYHFNVNKLKPYLIAPKPILPVNVGQFEYEWEFLRKKCLTRNPDWVMIKKEVNPMFVLRDGGIEPWEHIKEL